MWWLCTVSSRCIALNAALWSHYVASVATSSRKNTRIRSEQGNQPAKWLSSAAHKSTHRHKWPVRFSVRALLNCKGHPRHHIIHYLKCYYPLIVYLTWTNVGTLKCVLFLLNELTNNINDTVISPKAPAVQYRRNRRFSALTYVTIENAGISSLSL